MPKVMHNVQFTMTIDDCPICFAQWPISDEVYRIVSLNDELPNVPPNVPEHSAKRKREKV